MIQSLVHYFQKYIWAIAYGFLLVVCSYFIYRSYIAPLSDFAGYYFGAKFLLAGHFDSLVYFPSDFNLAIYTQYHTLTYIGYTPFPPFTAVFFVPFAFFSIAIAKLLFNLTSLFLFVVSVYRLQSVYKFAHYWVLAIPFVFLIPLRNNFMFGQVYLILFFLFAEGFIAFQKERHSRSSLFWGVAIILKIFPAFIFAYLLANRSWKAIMYLAMSTVGLFLFSLLFIDLNLWTHYFIDIMPRLSFGELNNPHEKGFQSMFMLLKNVFVFDELSNPSPIFHSITLMLVVWAIFRAGVLATCFSFQSESTQSNLPQFAFWVTASYLLSPNGSTYSLILLVFPFLALTTQPTLSWKVGMQIILLALVCCFPWRILMAYPLLFQFPRLWLLLLFFASYFLYFHPVPRFQWLTFAGFTLLLGLPILLPKDSEKDNSHYALKDPRLTMMYSLTTQDTQLRFSEWTENGLQWRSLNLSTIPASEKQAYIKDNQVYLENRQLTQSKDNKRDAVLVNNHEVVYLSDKNRGIGFFTLRSIELNRLP